MKFPESPPGSPSGSKFYHGPPDEEGGESRRSRPPAEDQEGIGGGSTQIYGTDSWLHFDHGMMGSFARWKKWHRESRCRLQWCPGNMCWWCMLDRPSEDLWLQVYDLRTLALKHEVLQSPCIWVGNSVSHDLPQERGGEEAVLCGWRGLVWCDAPQGWQIFSNGRWTLGTGKEWVYYNEPIVVFTLSIIFIPCVLIFGTLQNEARFKLRGVGSPSASLLAAAGASWIEGSAGRDRPHMCTSMHSSSVSRTRL